MLYISWYYHPYIYNHTAALVVQLLWQDLVAYEQKVMIWWLIAENIRLFQLLCCRSLSSHDSVVFSPYFWSNKLHPLQLCRHCYIWNGVWSLGGRTRQTNIWFEECFAYRNRRVGAANICWWWHEALLWSLHHESNSSQGWCVLPHVWHVENIGWTLFLLDWWISAFRTLKGEAHLIWGLFFLIICFSVSIICHRFSYHISSRCLSNNVWILVTLHNHVSKQKMHYHREWRNSTKLLGKP